MKRKYEGQLYVYQIDVIITMIKVSAVVVSEVSEIQVHRNVAVSALVADGCYI